MTAHPLTAIVLAAGRSRRLGQPKQLLPFSGTTLLGCVVDHAMASPVDRVVLVLGPGMGDVARSVARPGLCVVQTPSSARACAVSLQTGLAAQPDTGTAVLLLGDQPGVTPEIVGTVLAAAREAPGPVAVASYRGSRGHPFVLAGPALAEAAGLQGDRAVWALLEAHPAWVTEVPVDCPVPRDVDTWDDYVALLEECGLSVPPGAGGEGSGRP